MPTFANKLLDWFDHAGRHDLPWQQNVNAYRVWISEIMLQQTQVATVIPYFERFTARFPTLALLADAPIDDVLHLWSGLGYYARARNLHRSAGVVKAQHAGELPRDVDALIALPGIGRSTAGAIMALAYDTREPILDGNVKRVLARYHAVDGWPGTSDVAKRLWTFAESNTPRKRVADYTQAIMDLGATVCLRSKPRCEVCPLSDSCIAFKENSQSEFPGRKPRKVLPEKHARFLLPRARDGSILLWRRPSSGIWGGLWSCPELTPEEDIEAWCNHHGLRQLGEAIARPRLAHTFTHFRLTIDPFIVDVDRTDLVMDSNSWLWYKVSSPARVGIAKPVEHLLSTIE